MSQQQQLLCHILAGMEKTSVIQQKKLLAHSVELRRKGIDEGLLVDLNDSGYTFDEIADYLGHINE